MRYIFTILLFGLIVSIPVSLNAQNQSTIDEENKSELITDIANSLEQNYVFPEIGKRYSEELTTRYKQGEFSDYKTEDEFSTALTEVLQEINSDRHLRIISPANSNSMMRRPPEGMSFEDLMKMRSEQEKKENFFFDKVEVLPGNLGYFRLNKFPIPDPAKEKVDAIMTFLKDTDAIIFDLRTNPGGLEGLNQYISSYFFEENNNDILYTRYYRPGDSTLTVRVLPELPSARIPDKDLYILVGPFTGSSAENLAYSLQSKGRAKIIGESTAGAAHSSRVLPLSHGFNIQMPIARVSNPTTNDNWEGHGVIPDVQTEYENAHLIAQKMILEDKIATISDPREKELYVEAMKAITEQLSPKKSSMTSSRMHNRDLESFVGTYGNERHVRIDDEGFLTYKRDGGVDLRLEKIEGDLYKLTLSNPNMRLANELPNVRFERDANNKITGITLVFEDGRIAGQYDKTK